LTISAAQIEEEIRKVLPIADWLEVKDFFKRPPYYTEKSWKPRFFQFADLEVAISSSPRGELSGPSGDLNAKIELCAC
jgi:hypothetical protein